jgi:hypothetical protein
MPSLAADHLHRLSDVDREARRATCSICGPETGIWVQANREASCAVARSDARKKRRESDPEYRDKLRAYHRQYQRLWRFQLTPEGFEALMNEAGWACAICDRGLTKKSARIDHDHSCCPPGGQTCGGCVRGILCNGCNSALGIIERDDWMVRASEYLARRDLAA